MEQPGILSRYRETHMKRYCAYFRFIFVCVMGAFMAPPLYASPLQKTVIAESSSSDSVYRVVSATNGEGAWYEISRTDSKSNRSEVLAQDQQIFTNTANDGGAAIPAAAKRQLALGYADHVISKAGGIDAYSLSLRDYATYGIPLPSGLFREALIEKGVRMP